MRIEDVYINERPKIDNIRKVEKSTINSSYDKVEIRIIELISNFLNRIRA
jgi:hypothetical protein